MNNTHSEAIYKSCTTPAADQGDLIETVTERRWWGVGGGSAGRGIIYTYRIGLSGGRQCEQEECRTSVYDPENEEVAKDNKVKVEFSFLYTN